MTDRKANVMVDCAEENTRTISIVVRIPVKVKLVIIYPLLILSK